MAQLYGGRWRLLDKPPLGNGGQADVFRVIDESGVVPGESALKRVRNPKRHARFLREIEAIKRLTDPVTNQSHPNVVSLIDHSALDDAENPAKQYLVMPIAEGRDLSDPDRLSLYENSLDGVLIVAKQIASALKAAHAVEVIHRDVKPENVLFTGSWPRLVAERLWNLSHSRIAPAHRVTRSGRPLGIHGARVGNRWRTGCNALG